MLQELSVKEQALRRTIPVVINSFNQPTYLRNIVERFLANGFINLYVIDQGSTSQELLDMYVHWKNDGSDVQPLFLNENLGPRYFHYSGLYEMFGPIPHLYTDPDLDFDFLASDFLSRLLELSERYCLFKVGCALEIPSPEQLKPGLFCIDRSGTRHTVPNWEASAWINELEPQCYFAAIDTTLHFFNPRFYNRQRVDYMNGIRVASPGFVVRHLPWYVGDPIPIEEQAFYQSHGNSFNTWKRDEPE